MLVTLAAGVAGFTANQVVPLPEVLKPAMMVVENGKLYILEKTTVYIYSLTDFKLLKRFGREGEGPGEFMARPFGPPMTMSFSGGKLVVNSNNRLSYFTGDGEFLSERKAPPNLVFYQIKDMFVAVGPRRAEDGTFNINLRLVNNDYTENQVLYKTIVGVQFTEDILLPLEAFTYNPVYKENIFVAADSADFVIDSFDHTGKKLSRIRKNHKKIKVTEKFKQDTYRWFQTDPGFKRFYENIKQNIRFKEYYPAIRDIKVSDDTIHVITFKQRGGLWECVLLDLNGKEKKRLFIPLSRYIPFSFYALLYSAEKGNIYSLVENEDEETWELHLSDVR